MAIPIVPLVLIGVGLIACSAALKTPKSKRVLFDLAGSEWGFGDGSDRFVQFSDDKEFRGNGGCNNFFGTYDLNGTRLKVGPIASTKRACPELDQEREFLTALQKATRIEATHLVLKFFDVNGDELLLLKRRDWD